jgi:hypothetical protein
MMIAARQSPPFSAIPGLDRDVRLLPGASRAGRWGRATIMCSYYGPRKRCTSDGHARAAIRTLLASPELSQYPNRTDASIEARAAEDIAREKARKKQYVGPTCAFLHHLDWTDTSYQREGQMTRKSRLRKCLCGQNGHPRALRRGPRQSDHREAEILRG